jgi:hypothetical protein
MPAVLGQKLLDIQRAAIAIPHFVPARFTSSGEPLSVRVRVADQDGVPVEGATVRVGRGWETTVTGMDGECEAMGRLPAGGTVGRSATMRLHGTLQITAPGYQTWERSMVSLFGEEHHYVGQPGTLTRDVILIK